MRAAAVKDGDVQRMQAWAGQSAALVKAEPAAETVLRLWREAKAMLPAAGQAASSSASPPTGTA
jgi:nitronate monooxygenase